MNPTDFTIYVQRKLGVDDDGKPGSETIGAFDRLVARANASLPAQVPTPIGQAPSASTQRFVEKTVRSPWCDARGMTPSIIVVHHSCGSYLGTIDWITVKSHNSQVSYHCVLDYNGERTVMVPDELRAWHVGVGEYNGDKRVNSMSLGIAFSGDTNDRDLNPQELASAVEKIHSWMAKWNIPKSKIVSHKQVARPIGRKDDVTDKALKQILEIV